MGIFMICEKTFGDEVWEWVCVWRGCWNT